MDAVVRATQDAKAECTRAYMSIGSLRTTKRSDKNSSGTNFRASPAGVRRMDVPNKKTVYGWALQARVETALAVIMHLSIHSPQEKTSALAKKMSPMNA